MVLCSRSWCRVALVSMALTGQPLFGQEAGQGDALETTAATSPLSEVSEEVRQQVEQWVEDYIHWVIVARPDMAQGAAQAILDSGISDAAFYRIVDELDRMQDLDDALVRGARVESLAPTTGQLEMKLRRGRRDLARDPAEIDRHIENLEGSARARMMAVEALREAGEFAVPQLLDVLASPSSTASQKAQVRSVLVAIGRQAVLPLTVAMPHLDPVTQERVVGILAEVGYPQALPALYELSVDTGVPGQVRDAAARAYLRLGGWEGASVAGLWLELAEQFWREQESLIPWPVEETNNVWEWQPQVGLTATPVPTAIFAEVMAMRTSENALMADPQSADALALWVASNFRRSDQLPEDVEDPTYGPTRRVPIFYAVAAGPEVSQRVLARALRDVNARLARHAIQALEGTAGGASLWIAQGGASPLVEALTFPERRVRYDAALAFARALPMETFEGADRVTPILASAIQSGNERYAAVVADDPQEGRALAASLRYMGFTVLPVQPTFEALQQDLVQSVGVDVVVASVPGNRVGGIVEQAHRTRWTAAAPILAVVPLADVTRTNQEFASDRLVNAVREGLSEEQFTAAVDRLLQRTTGPLITIEEANRYTEQALRSLRDIAVRNTPAFDASVAQAALIGALNQQEGELRLLAAETLSWIGTADAQWSLLDAALLEEDEMTQIALLDFVASSAKRFGAFASDRQVNRLLELVETSAGPVATAAAKAYGALNLPTDNVVRLVLGDGG